jgi:hypothetical protein
MSLFVISMEGNVISQYTQNQAIEDGILKRVEQIKTKCNFPLGRIVATPGALETISDAGQLPDFFLEKHCQGNWGDICNEDKQMNEEALISGGRLFSAYITNENEKIWVITESDRSSTTLLKPDEY